MPLPSFFHPARGRGGVSELYASVLMVGVTLSVGSLALAAAAGYFSAGAPSLAASLQEGSAGVRLSLAYAAVPPVGSCPAYRGLTEGTSITVALYDYGSSDFGPAGFVVNSTSFGGSYAVLGPGTLGEYTIPLGTCAHQSGQTILVYDPSGDEVQLGT